MERLKAERRPRGKRRRDDMDLQGFLQRMCWAGTGLLYHEIHQFNESGIRSFISSHSLSLEKKSVNIQ